MRSGSQLSVLSTGQQFDMFIKEKNEGIYWFFTNSCFILVQDVAPTIIGIKLVIAKFMFTRFDPEDLMAFPEPDIDISARETLNKT